jgi:hypothetical protein
VKKHKTGKTINFVVDCIDEIVERMADGETLYNICRRPDMPNLLVVKVASKENPEIGMKLQMARELQADYCESKHRELVEKCRENNFSSTRVRLHGLQWHAKMYDRRRFGDQQEVKSTNVNQTTVISKDMTPKQAAEAYANSIES